MELSVSEVSVEASVVDGWVLLVLVKLPVMIVAAVLNLVELPAPIVVAVAVELYPLAWMVVMCTTTLLLLTMVTDILGIVDIVGLQILSASIRTGGGQFVSSRIERKKGKIEEDNSRIWSASLHSASMHNETF